MAPSTELFAAFFRGAPDAVVVVDGTGVVVDANDAAVALFGYPHARLVGLPVDQLLPARVRRRHGAHRVRFGAAPARRPMGEGVPLVALRRDGTEVPVDISLSPVTSGGETVVLAAVRDVTDRRLAEQRLAASERRFRAIFEDVPVGLGILDPQARFVDVNDALCRLLGYECAQIVGRSAEDVLPVGGGRGTADRRVTSASGQQRWVAVTVSELGDGSVVIVEDVTARKEEEVRLLHLATHDELTGLVNRAALDDRLVHALARAGRTGQHVAVLFLDLDGFKGVNDAYGHAAGDDVLRAVAGRVGEALRPADTAARPGGDEFVVLCEDLGTDAAEASAAAEEIAGRIRAAVSRPIAVAGTSIRITTSVGACWTADPAGAPDALIAAADSAMYVAKRSGAGYAVAERVSGAGGTGVDHEWSVRR